ncbi:BatA domain-containing protein [Flavitalea sp.]|nr:BatA domain-containing protein [Flavitalea sp.]
MLQFVNPIWLAAGIGITIPVIIHLWNVRKGKVLRIGSTLLMSDATQQNTSSLRLSQWLLLLIRCLMILFLAMLMAGPEWHANKQRNGKGWVLIDKKDFRVIYSQLRSPIDSLLNKGFELRSADEAFEKINVADSSEFMARGAASPKKTFSYWSMLLKADQLLPAGYPVYFFSNDKLADVAPNNFSRRPIVSIDLRWQMAQTDTAFTAIPALARQLSSGGYQLASFQPANNGSHFIKSVSLNTPVNFRQTDTSSILVTIYHNKFSEDLRYLQSAIRAIAGFENYKLSLITVDEISNIPKSQHWLFWLSNEIPPENLSTENLFVYQPGTTVKTKSWLTTKDGAVPPDAINIYQRIADTGKKPGPVGNLDLVWKDGYGNPLLTLEDGNGSNDNNTDDVSSTDDVSDTGKAIPGKNIYRFYTRFHPAWSDLSWNPEFPKLLFPFIIEDQVKGMVEGYDERRTEVADVIPTVVRQTYKDNKSAFEVIELSNLFWLITFVLFASERIISINKRNTKQAANV